jgi:hypothetical protein
MPLQKKWQIVINSQQDGRWSDLGFFYREPEAQDPSKL